MNNTIIALYGRAREGKSASIKKVVQIFEARYKSVEILYKLNDGDILATVRIGNVLIGIESQGDPNSRMIENDTIQSLIDEGCRIIICATRTEGMTVGKVDELAAKNNFNTLWKSSYYTNKLDHDSVNMICAEEIVSLVESLITERI